MNSVNINIHPKEFQSVSTATSIELNILEIVLRKSVKIMVRLRDSNGNSIKSEIFLIEGQEYQQWGTDDSYLENLILQKLQVEKI